MIEEELAVLFLEREIKKQYLRPMAGEGGARWGTGVRPKSMIYAETEGHEGEVGPENTGSFSLNIQKCLLNVNCVAA